MGLIEKSGMEYISALYTGNIEVDDLANSELYLELVRKGKEEGFCPVLADKDIEHYIGQYGNGYSDSNEDYLKATNNLIRMAEENALSIWEGRIIYNYYLDCVELEEEYDEYLERLIPPENIPEYDKLFLEPIAEKKFRFGYTQENVDYGFSYEKLVFLKVPVKEPWKVLAYVPMGGFNWCPDPMHQVGLAKWLFEYFGIRIAYISFTSLEYYIPSVITYKGAIEMLAKMLVAADNDVYEDYELSAKKILGSHNLHMWWD